MPIQLAFQDEKLRQVCESSVSAKRRLGEVAARLLQTRLADLRAAESPTDLVDLGFAQFEPASDTRIDIDIGDGYVVIAMANHRPELRLATGKLDWKRVTRLKILSVKRANEN